MNPAIKWLETDWECRRSATEHQDMAELKDDHPNGGRCHMCKGYSATTGKTARWPGRERL